MEDKATNIMNIKFSHCTKRYKKLLWQIAVSCFQQMTKKKHIALSLTFSWNGIVRRVGDLELSWGGLAS